MRSPAITLEVLPAGYGDCLLVTCPIGKRSWRILVDTGPDETYSQLRRRLEQIPKNGAGKRRIDLFVVTHIDHDHIGGASLLLNDRELNLSFGDIWFNAPPRPAVRGVAEGESLAQLLGAQDVKLPWNLAWAGKPVSTPAIGGGVEMAGKGLPRITLLSPTPDRLKALYRNWTKELERLRRKERDLPEPEPIATRESEPNLEALAARVTPTDSAIPNGSSIAFLLEYQGASVLLGADAIPTVLVPAIKALAARRTVAGPLPVDVVKLSHHGSRANVTQDLIRAVAADHFVFSTNNAIFHHPNDEAVARVITGSVRPTLWFNYDTPKNRKWAAEPMVSKYGYSVWLPGEEGTGVKIELAARRKLKPGLLQPPLLEATL